MVLKAKAFAFWSLAGVLSVGCVQSALNPGDPVTATGSALNQDKSPLSGAELTLTRSENSVCGITAAFSKPKTDGSGGFTQQLTGKDTQNGDLARCFQLSLPPGAGGAQTSAEFLMQVTDVKIPALQRWTGAVSVGQGAGGAQLSFTDLSSSHGLPGLAYTTTVSSGAATVWRKVQVSSPIAFHDEVLEDFPNAVATASASRDVKGSGTTFLVHYASDGAPLPGRQKIPASRGAPCTYAGAPAGACPLTDGRADKVLMGGAAQQVLLQLPAAKAIKKLVVRGLVVSVPSLPTLEGSNDGASWTTLATLSDSDPYQELDLPAGTAAFSQYRLGGTRTGTGSFAVLGLDELSLFEN